SRGTQANTYSDRTRSQGASSDTGEGSLERRLNRRRLYGRHAVDSGSEVLGTIIRKRRECGIDLGDDARVERLAQMRGSPAARARWARVVTSTETTSASRARERDTLISR